MHLLPAVLKAKIKKQQICFPRIRAEIVPEPQMPLGKWQSGPSPPTPWGGRRQTQNKKRPQIQLGSGPGCLKIVALSIDSS